MADAEDNNDASGGAGENPEEEEEEEEKALVEGVEGLALEQPREDIANLPRVFLKLETTGDNRDYPQWVLWTQKCKVPSVKNSELANVPPLKPAEEPDSRITQIKAQCGEHEWSTFFDPSIPIERQTSAESGNTPVGQPGEPVGTREALEGFLQFLGKLPVALMGHKIEENIGHLLREARRCGMIDQLGAVIRGFVDTRPLFRKCAQEFQSLASGNRDPTADELALPGISAENVSSFTKVDCRLSWNPLVKADVIKKDMMDKAVCNQLHFDTVRQAFAEGGEERAREVLKQRLTKKQSTLDKICRYLCENAEQ